MDVPCLLQDVSFNVGNSEEEAQLLQALFQNDCKILRETSDRQVSERTVGFGPDSYEKSETFFPGVSSLYEYGGHSTISLHSKEVNGELSEAYISGNGLRHIKVGAESIRISKAVEKGAAIKFAFGWVNMNTKSGIPLEIVIGESRDPLMYAALQVNDLQESVKFFTEELGMRELPFPLARINGSAYEPRQPKGSVYLGYMEGTFGLLLNKFNTIQDQEEEVVSIFGLFTYKKKPAVDPNAKLVVGSQLRGFTVLYDDETSDISKLPKAAQRSLANGENNKIILSPDGYPFILTPYSKFKMYATEVASREEL